MSTQARQWGNLIEEAQRWERVLREEAGSAERAAFAAWIKRSPQHLEAYLENLVVDRELRRLDADGEFDIEALLAKASNNVIQLTPPGRPQTDAATSSDSRRSGRRGLFGIAASSALAICLIMAIVLSRSQWSDYITETGEQRRIVLPDGSSVDLNTQSHMRVSLRPGSREVDLLSGEAMFNIQHDASRPFRVHVQGKIIEDLGTQFSVYLRPDASTTVSVVDGRVQIRLNRSEIGSTTTPEATAGIPSKLPSMSTQLSAGEQVHISPSGESMKRSTVDVAEVASWREHRLLFENAQLSEVAAEFNRYNKRQLRIGNDAALLNKRYTAIFDAYDPESFVQALRDDPSLTVLPAEGGIIVQSR